MDSENYPAYLDSWPTFLRVVFTQVTAAFSEKYQWLYDRYVKAIEFFENVGPDDEYRINNPEIYNAVASLPKLNSA